MWGSRAEQIYQTVAKFSKPQLERAMKLIYETDRGLRDARPDDRTVMERFVLELRPRLLRGALEGFDAQMQAGFITGRGVFRDDAQFGRAVDHGERRRQQSQRARGIL